MRPTLRARHAFAKLRAFVGGHADPGETGMMKMLRASAAACLLACAFLATGAAAQTVTAIEYHHVAFDHYFLTIDPAEINALDTGFFAGWTRTGYAFDVSANVGAGLLPVCRFFSTSFGIKSSHFYTPNPVECDGVKLNPDWQYEDIRFHVPVPAGDGTCGAGLRPVHRLYNQGQGGAPNHRFTTEIAVRATMLANGWVSEGISFCSPLPLVVPSAAAGIWTGMTSLNERVRAVVVDDGRYFILYSSPGDTNDSGVWHGTATTANGTFTSSDGKRYPIAQQQETSDRTTAITLSGTYVAHATLDLAITDLRGTRTLSAAYLAGSDQPLSLAPAAGVYSGITGHVNGRQLGSFTLLANGAFGGSNPACAFVGNATTRASVAVADMSLQPNPPPCIFGSDAITGILDHDAAARKVRVFLPFNGSFDMFYVTGTKN